jgi:hypothetical protein
MGAKLVDWQGVAAKLVKCGDEAGGLAVPWVADLLVDRHDMGVC